MVQSRTLPAILLSLVASAALVSGQGGSSLSMIPGAQTASGVIASTLDGTSRYLAQDGPIQPAITAIGGLPLRAVEGLNNGITHISSGLRNGAQASARAAGGDDQNIRMPGMAALESSMPASFASIGNQMHGAIQAKNKWIMGQADRGIQAGQRLGKMMHNGMSVSRSKSPMVGASNMIEQAHEAMSKGASQIQGQLKQSMSGVMDRMGSLRGMGDNMMGQVRGMGQTLQEGLQKGMENGQQMGQKLRSQLEGGLKQNMGALSGMMDSMQGGMGQAGQNMQKNMRSALSQAQNAASQIGDHLQQAVSGPMNMLKGMMNGGGSSGSRY